ncbi:unnamed product [Ostreococcus tauri]|uniref:Unnamed product n=1 Tax=Ostreococcus tauri TaxID=70448 RepID=A0A096P8D9_OSTTA|nr:unnamed product [Ostreococcus tauri]CEG00169.1 unnamed product [Ostreococcus tauri]|eukprot:XP_022840231.1 unnamed product [Ostreococcus tauri]
MDRSVGDRDGVGTRRRVPIMSRVVSARASDLAHTAENARVVSRRLEHTRAATQRAVELTEKALGEFQVDGGVDGGNDFTGDDGQDGELGELVRQLESFAEKRTGAGRSIGSENGGQGRDRGENQHARSDKWNARSGGSDHNSNHGDDDDGANSLVGLSMMYGSTVDDGASVGDLDDVQSVDFGMSSVDFDLGAGNRGGRQDGRSESRFSEIGSVTGRINAVNDSLASSKARLNASIASLEKEAGIANGAFDRDFEQYKDDMPIVGNTTTGQPVIDVVARGVNSLSRSNSQALNGRNGSNGGSSSGRSVSLFDSIFGCCIMRDRQK